jgi:uncharacterized protein (DUF2062 family)
MARKIIKSLIPDPDWIKQQKSLQIFGGLLHDPNIWHLNRHSVATAAFIGLFAAFIPLPTQMIIAALLAILLRANLAISVSLVWITNPFTVAPIFYLAYKVGAAVIGTGPSQFTNEFSWTWLSQELASNWQPFLLGCLLCGLFSGLLASTIIRWAWRKHTIKRWHDRRLRRQNRKKNKQK